MFLLPWHIDTVMVIQTIIVVFIEFPVFFFLAICIYKLSILYLSILKLWVIATTLKKMTFCNFSKPRVLQLDKGRWLYDSDTNINKEVFFKLIIYLERRLIKELKKRSKLRPSLAADKVSAVCCVSNITSS